MSFISLPGLIDPHVHLRDPGQTQKEDFYTGTCAAIAGGYTTIVDMPNNTIPITTEKRLLNKITRAKQKIVCDVGFHFGSLGNNLSEFKKVENRVIGLKLYLNETTGNFLIDRKKLQSIFEAWPKRKVILLHAEGEAIFQVIDIVKFTGNKVHFCHISTLSDLKQIIYAKQKNLPVTVGVTPHHLFLTENDLDKLGPFGKMKPPLGSKKDVDFLWKNIRFIDCIESDHAPHTLGEKNSSNPPFGIPGLETTLPLLLTSVSQKRLTLKDIYRLCFQKPKQLFNIKQDITTQIQIDPKREYIIESKNLFTKCKWTPFAGMKVKGKVEKVFIRNTKVFENGKILVGPGFGRCI